ncbi:MAG: hypothetical protein GY756_13495 [bacterium]|nr:hypothetical protein [bacterium]
MKITLSRLLPFSLLVIYILSSCSKSYVNFDNMDLLRKEKRDLYTVLSVDYSDDESLIDIDQVTLGLNNYFQNHIGIDSNIDHFRLVILPDENEVIDFKSRGSSASTFYKKRIIFLLDFYNLEEELYEKYGPAPKDILLTSFTHEYTHNLTYKEIYNLNYIIFEAMSVFCSWIDFRVEPYIKHDNPDLENCILRIYSKEKLSKLEKSGLDSIDKKEIKDELAFFLYFLHSIQNYEAIHDILTTSNLGKTLSEYNDKFHIDYYRWISSFIL